MKKAAVIFAFILLISSIVGFDVQANDSVATDITAQCTVTADGESVKALADNNIYTYKKVKEIVINSESAIHGLYIKFDKQPTEWKLNADGFDINCGKDGFLHEFVEINGAKNLTLNLGDGIAVADIFVFGAGASPEWVHHWERAEQVDIMICPTHSDDDQLYFAGLIPWCAAKGYTVQVVYFTNHFDTHDRPHELLEGLWHNGVRYYPHFSPFPDKYANSVENAIDTYENSDITREDMVEYQVEVIGRYKPLVIAGHDFNGEYGHGVHILNAKTLAEAVELAAEREIWDVPKTYIHLWEENATVFDWDTPMEELGGKTPFQISQESYQFHKSQHRFENLYRWLYGTESKPITKATDIRSYSPAKFGLYRSTVGADSGIGDVFENIIFEHSTGTEFIPCKTYEFFENKMLERFSPYKFMLPAVTSVVSETDDNSSVDDSSESAESFESESSAESLFSEESREKPDDSYDIEVPKKSPFRVNKFMAVIPFAIVIIAYFIISAIKRD